MIAGNRFASINLSARLVLLAHACGSVKLANQADGTRRVSSTFERVATTEMPPVSQLNRRMMTAAAEMRRAYLRGRRDWNMILEAAQPLELVSLEVDGCTSAWRDRLLVAFLRERARETLDLTLATVRGGRDRTRRKAFVEACDRQAERRCEPPTRSYITSLFPGDGSHDVILFLSLLLNLFLRAFGVGAQFAVYTSRLVLNQPELCFALG